VAGVDAFITAMERSDDAALLALLRYTAVPCAAAGYPRPACPAGVADGTLLDSFYYGRCEVGFYVDADTIRRFVLGDFATLAVARLPVAARTLGEGGYPTAEYMVLMEDQNGPTGEPRAAFISGDGVVSLHVGCCCVSARKFLEDQLAAYSPGAIGLPWVLAPR
jgi:hypothetical protein